MPQHLRIKDAGSPCSAAGVSWLEYALGATCILPRCSLHVAQEAVLNRSSNHAPPFGPDAAINIIALASYC